MCTSNTAYVLRCRELSQYAFDTAYARYGDDLLMATVHGSWLYGTAHEHSDTDLYVVVDNVRTKQHVGADGLDVMRINTAAYFEQLSHGAHQAVEAHHSPYRVINTNHPWARMFMHTVPSARGFVRKSLSASTAFRRNVADELVEQRLAEPTTTIKLMPGHNKAIGHAARLGTKAATVLHAGFAEYTPVWIPH